METNSGTYRLGAPKAQVIEVMLQMTFHAGGAAVSNALRIADRVFKCHED